MSLYHISLPCTDLRASGEFYTAILKPLGYKTYLQTRDKIFFRPSLSFQSELSLRRDRSCGPIGGTRITIYVSSRSQVDKFMFSVSSIVDFDGNVIEAIYLKLWVLKIIIQVQ
ncbi:hypothetical protein BOTCAL_0050g00190 [Botryotinia calthae]|uniref:Glyoxalase/fosfomycin resistance/dioxygenase domain-containing protein n=1 Tax=Botryotinia calthae TaxID=38488 RepID=A0A4Y8DBG3_9HELO|nr:hypothetical protein BOTCAL_0050g00190 [Botryotinia calthae]